MLENRFFGKDDAGDVNHLRNTLRGSVVIGQVAEFFDSLENHVNRLRSVAMHVVQLHFLGFDLLRSDVTMSGANAT